MVTTGRLKGRDFVPVSDHPSEQHDGKLHIAGGHCAGESVPMSGYRTQSIFFSNHSIM